MDTVIQLTGAERGFIMLKNHETGEMEFKIARGLDREQLTEDQFTISRTVINKVAESGEPTLTDNASSDPRFQGQQSIVGFSLRSIMAVPLNARDDLIGVVYCDNRIFAGVFKDQDLRLVADFANQSAIAIENARLIEAGPGASGRSARDQRFIAERAGVDCQRGHHHQRRRQYPHLQPGGGQNSGH